MKRKRLLYLLGAVIILLIAVVIYNNHFTALHARTEAEAIFSRFANTAQDTITDAALQHLPTPVQRYLRHAGVVGMPNVHTVRLRQQGTFRRSPDDAWHDLEAVQYFTVNPPAFVWYAVMKMPPFIWIAARDKYEEGKGNMLVKPFSTFTLADVTGPEMDQGAMTRFLSEMMWFPGAWVSNYLTWEAIDSTSARVTMAYYGMNVSGILRFTMQGELLSFSTERYYSGGKTPVLTPWVTPVLRYASMNGIMIPIEGEAVWKMKSGDFSYIRVRITALDINTPAVYN